MKKNDTDYLHLPDVFNCNSTSCAFNNEEKCIAGAVNIGGPDPLCDTFIEKSKKKL